MCSTHAATNVVCSGPNLGDAPAVDILNLLWCNVLPLRQLEDVLLPAGHTAWYHAKTMGVHAPLTPFQLATFMPA